MGESTAYGEIGGKANVSVTAVGNVDAGEDNLITYALPADALSANGQVVKIKAWGTAANNANAKTLKLYFGSQAILTWAITASKVIVWKVEAYVVRTGVDTQDCYAVILETSIGSPNAQLTDQELTAGTQDDGAAITIKCTGEGVATNDIVQEGLLVEFLN